MVDSEPQGIASDCFWVLGMYAPRDGLTAVELHGHVAAENESMGWPVRSRHQVRVGLQGLARRRPPLVERAGGVWRISAYGHAMMDVWAGPLDDDQVRVPCGLGWPV
jgi:hypothetical protein